MKAFLSLAKWCKVWDIPAALLIAVLLTQLVLVSYTGQVKLLAQQVGRHLHAYRS